MAHRSSSVHTVLAGVLALALAPPDDVHRQTIARGDGAWLRRAEGRVGLRPAPGPIAEAVAAYEQALAARPDDLEARWKLARALFYQGKYVLEHRADRLAVFARGRDLGEGAIDRLAESAGGRAALDRMQVAEVVRTVAGRPEATPVFFWACVQWGLWGRETGKLAAVHQGVADRVRRYAEVVIGLDERFETAGAHRILGRLHFQAPRVPFITGWVDDRSALAALRRAAELAPEDPLNELYLVEALHAYERPRRAEALARLRTLVERQPRPDRPVEDGHTLADARTLLEQWTR